MMDVAMMHLWANGYIADEPPQAIPEPEPEPDPAPTKPAAPVKTKRKRRK